MSSWSVSSTLSATFPVHPLYSNALPPPSPLFTTPPFPTSMASPGGLHQFVFFFFFFFFFFLGGGGGGVVEHAAGYRPLIRLHANRAPFENSIVLEYQSEGYRVPTERRGVSKWTNVLSCDFRIRPRILPSALQDSD